MRALAPVLGSYRPTRAEDVAAAMINDAHREPGRPLGAATPGDHPMARGHVT